MKNQFLLVLFLSFCHFSTALFSQNELTRYQDKYPDKNGVFLHINENVKITINKEGKPEIVSEYDEERLFLNENYKYYTEESVSFSSFTSIENLEASVFIPQGEKYKKNKIVDIVEEDDYDGSVFKDDTKKKKFFYAGLEKGGKTTLSYAREIFEPRFFGTFFFSSFLPVESSKYVIQTPVDMKITFELFGDEKDKVKYTETVNGKFKIHTWEANDLEDFSFEDESVNVRYFATHLQVYINTYEHKDESKYIIRDIDDLYEYYRGFVREVNKEKSPELKMLADSLTRDKTTEEEKVKTIFLWVQDNIKYVAFEAGMGGFVPREAKFVCERKYGDCKDMTSILYEMINSIGISAYYTWIGSRDIPYSYSQVPTPSVDNHMICSYHDGEKYVFLDGTGKGLPYGKPTGFIQGKEALIGISETEYKVVTVPIQSNSDNTMIDTVYMRLDEGILRGNANVTYTGYPAIHLSNYLNNSSQKEKEEFYKNSFKKGNNKCISKVTEVIGEKNRDNPLKFIYEFEIDDYVKENGDELYFNPFLKKYHSGSKINIETNKNDKEKLFKEINRNVVYMEIPEGYEVEYLPESIFFENDKFSAEVKIEMLKEKNQIEIQTVYNFDYLILDSETFPEWNKMIKALNLVYTELIIFKKQK